LNVTNWLYNDVVELIHALQSMKSAVTFHHLRPLESGINTLLVISSYSTTAIPPTTGEIFIPSACTVKFEAS
jgi:hypothetical protein